MIVAVPVTQNGEVDSRWGKADQVAVAKVTDDQIDAWNVHETGWHKLHDQSHQEGHHGGHHARIVRFLRDNEVETVVIHHAGAPMINTMEKMGLNILVNASGPAKDAVLAAAAQIDCG